MPPLRIGLIGCGGINTRHATHLITLPDQVQLVGFIDPSLDKAGKMAATYGANNPFVSTDHHALFDNANLDGVLIGIPPHAHTDQVDIAASRGVHIFIEKPIAISLEKAWHMVEVCEKAGITTQVGFMFRFGTAVERLKALIDSGEAGPAGLMLARYFCNSLHSGWWRDKEKSGGQVFEQATHLIDLMRYLLGDALTAFSIQRNLFHQEFPDYTVEDVSGTLFNFQSGAIGVLAASNGAIPGRWEWDARLITRGLTAFIQDANHAEITFTAAPELRSEQVASDKDIYAAEMDDFLSAVLHQHPTRTPMREGARTLALGAAAALSASSRSEQSI
jgi:predicted dehydrogenase